MQTLEEGFAAMVRQMWLKVAREDDYKDSEGLVYCNGCHTLKSQYKTFFGSIVFLVPIPCKCRAEAAADEHEKRENARFIKSYNQYFDGISLRPDKDATFANDAHPDSDISRKCRKYADRFEACADDNIGLLLYGGVGTGKTYYAHCIVNDLLRSRVNAVITSVPKIMQNMSDFNGEGDATLKKIALCELLVLDDFGVGRDNDYGLEKLYSIIDARYQSGKPLIVTTNHSLAELTNPTDLKYRRIYERICEMCTLRVLVNGDNQRKDVSGRKKARVEELFGGLI